MAVFANLVVAMEKAQTMEEVATTLKALEVAIFALEVENKELRERIAELEAKA